MTKIIANVIMSSFLYGASSTELAETMYQEIAKFKAQDKELTELAQDAKQLLAKIKKEELTIEKGIYSLSKLHLKLYRMGGLSLIDSKKMVSSLFMSRHMMLPKDNEVIQRDVYSILKELQTKNPNEPDLHLLEVYRTDLSAPSEISEAKAALKNCLTIDPKHKKCRSMYENISQ